MKKSFIIGKETYNLISPTIKGTDMAIKSLGEITDKENIYEILIEKDKDKLCNALSYFISGDLSLTKKLNKGSKEEIAEAIKSLIIDIMQPALLQLSHIAKQLSSITAKPKL